MIADRVLAKYQKAHDAHLDNAAKADRWDSRITFALRSGYPNPWQEKATAFAIWMDACNAFGYQVMAEIASGSRAPLSIDEYIALLPELVLP